MRTLLAHPAVRRAAVACAFALWIVGVGWGMKLLLDYQVKAGKPAAAPQTWPAASSLAPPSRLPKLVLLVHPRCACSRATLTELARVASRTEHRLAIDILFVVPPGLDTTWAQSDLWRRARSIPGVHVTLDPDGHEARNFGAATSGQALFYSTEGRLEFAGGLTPGRGHEGDNAGEEAVLALALAGGPGTVTASTPVFGCAFASPNDPQKTNPTPVCKK